MPVVAAIPGIISGVKAVSGVVGAVGSVAGAIGSRRAASGSNKKADKLGKEATASGKSLQEIGSSMMKQSTERWDFYQQYGKNVDIMLIDDAVTMFKETFAGGSERAASRAAEDVASAFDRSAEVRRRAALRFGGVDPTSGKFAGLERETATERAKTEAFARFDARNKEEDRARSILGSASDLANRSLEQGNSFARTGIAAQSEAADIFSGQQTDQRREAAGSAALVGDIAGKIPFEGLFDAFSKKPAVTDTPAVTDSSGGGGFGGGGFGGNFRDGGVIPGDGRGGGRIKGRGTGTSDSVGAVVDGTNQKVRLSAGEFIIPEKIVRRHGERFFNKLIGR